MTAGEIQHYMLLLGVLKEEVMKPICFYSIEPVTIAMTIIGMQGRV
tara:strand:- start:133 stop:270 length:138 start_codon:yes stop_codon:yes gene_type:complete